MTAIAAWTEDFAALLAQIGPRFARSEARRHAADKWRVYVKLNRGRGTAG
jgi:hypothetical protein